MHGGWLCDRQTGRILFGRGGSVTCCCVVGGGRVEGHVENRGPANVSFLFSCSSKNLLTYMLIQRYWTLCGELFLSRCCCGIDPRVRILHILACCFVLVSSRHADGKLTHISHLDGCARLDLPLGFLLVLLSLTCCLSVLRIPSCFSSYVWTTAGMLWKCDPVWSIHTFS